MGKLLTAGHELKCKVHSAKITVVGDSTLTIAGKDVVTVANASAGRFDCSRTQTPCPALVASPSILTVNGNPVALQDGLAVSTTITAMPSVDDLATSD